MEDPKLLILADQNLKDIAQVMNAGIDIAIGKENDYEIKILRDEWRWGESSGKVVFVKGDEEGGG